ncbi:hypothetical protein [Lutimaribacter saemankumensis]|uniref:Uncharacterized protein n=1 Tax=Lutimaribacter saemankumensis TaxID=490829 RepID=A0A1G8JH65_9RHOB|nr:hypothetical protein [Lutimaribacter saemankumensis]SDI30431.1 hypothetical protein SAMN05421850_102141 [Lutimaribacter saemankumensis]
MSTQTKTDRKSALAALEQAFAYYDDAPKPAPVTPVHEDTYFEDVKAA